MSNSLLVDPAELRASAAKLMQQADETEQMLEALKATIADHGKCWGDDELGETFAQSYEPDSELGVEDFEALIEELRSMSAGLRDSADAFENQDRVGAEQVENSGPSAANSTDIPVPNEPVGPAVQPEVAGNTQSTGISPQRPEAAGQPVAEMPSPPELPVSPDSGLGSTPDFTPRQSPGSGRPQRSSQPGSPTTEALGRNFPRQSTPNTSSPRLRNTQANPPAGRQPETSAPRSGRLPAGRAVVESPWSQNKPVVPGPKPRAFPAASPYETPPRVAPPQAPTRPPGRGGPQPDELSKRPEKRSKPKVAPRADKPTDPEAMRIVGEMATRYGLSIVGFESAGLDARTAQDIADAVDIVLVRHPAALRGIEISEATSAPAYVENRGETPATVVPWIVLARTAAADPRLLAARIGREPGADALTSRPMFTAVLRELGSAFDLIGGFRARPEAQRALIAEYLRLNGAQGETLGRVVAGYKRWRAQLGDHCFDRGVFVSAWALTEAFVEVESRRNTASGPAKVLHRTLIALSR